MKRSIMLVGALGVLAGVLAMAGCGPSCKPKSCGPCMTSDSPCKTDVCQPTCPCPQAKCPEPKPAQCPCPAPAKCPEPKPAKCPCPAPACW